MTATADEARVRFLEMLNLARGRAAALDDGPVRSALSDEFFSGVQSRLTGPLSGWSTWPPLFMYAVRSEPGRLESLDAALRAVLDRTRPEKRAGMDSWLRADDSGVGVRTWRCGLFELVVKTRFLVGATDVEFDAALPNGRDVDIRATVAGRSMYFEATVITESDEDQGVWTRFMAAKANDEHAVLIRPGEHDTADAKGPSPYYDTIRVYSKSYDKLAKKGDPAKCQVSDDYPNVILLSVWTGHGMPFTSSPGIGWALDELFADQPNAGALKTARPESADVALYTFLQEAKPDRAIELLQSPRRLGAIATFSETDFSYGRANYNAHRANQVSHVEKAAIEAIAGLPLTWA